MAPAVARTCAAFLFLSFAATHHRSPKDNPAEEQIWLAVEEHPRGQLLIEPIVTVEGTHLTPIQTSCLSDTDGRQTLSEAFLQPGRKYSVLYGGAYVGDGLVKEDHREAHTAGLTYAGLAKIRGQSRALATNIDQRAFRSASREPATAEQRVSSLALAREIFSEHGIEQSLLPKVQIEYLTRTYLEPSALPSLIGSFTLDTGDVDGPLHALFFISSQPSDKLSPEFVWIHLSESGSDEEHLRFVDHADLFGDGLDEIVAKLVSVETQTHRYVIFRRTKDGTHWEQIFRTEPLGCFS